MGSEPLKYKPLVEAIFEVHWTINSQERTSQHQALIAGIPQLSVMVDPNFKLLLARMVDRLQPEYPDYQSLHSGLIPEGFPGLPNVPQHQIRHADKWPLIQLGPGILTVNDTEKYDWNDFFPRCLKAYETLMQSYPRPMDLKISSLMLRYLNAIEVDYFSENVCDYLKEKMGVSFGLPVAMFEKTAIKPEPASFQWNSSFRSDQPPGNMTLGFATGQKDGRNALILELVFQSAESDLPQLPGDLSQWLEDAHRITDDWFFKLIEGGTGELKRRFKGEV